MTNIVRAMSIYKNENKNQDIAQVKKILKLPMVAIILVSSIIGSIYVSFLRGLTQ